MFVVSEFAFDFFLFSLKLRDAFGVAIASAVTKPLINSFSNCISFLVFFIINLLGIPTNYLGEVIKPTKEDPNKVRIYVQYSLWMVICLCFCERIEIDI